MRRRWTSPILTGVLVGACVSAHSPRTTSGLLARRELSVLTAEEIATIPATSAYDAVHRLRPWFLHSTRGPQDALHHLHVYVNGMLRGGVDELAQISASEIREIRLLSAVEATTLYGTGNTESALDVRTGPPPR